MSAEQDLTSVMAPEGGGSVLDEPPPEAPRKKRSREEKEKEKESSPPKRARNEEAVIVPPPVDNISRRKKIQRIRNFVATWPDLLEEMVAKNDIENMNEAELDKFMDEVRLVVGTHSDVSIGDTAPEIGMVFYEKIMCALGLRVKGIHGIGRDPGFKKAFKEWLLEQDMMMYLPPHYRMMMMIGQATVALHMDNEDNPEYKDDNNPQQRPNGSRNDSDIDMMMNAANELRKKGAPTS